MRSPTKYSPRPAEHPNPGVEFSLDFNATTLYNCETVERGKTKLYPLAAIQGLFQELKDRDAKIATLEARLEAAEALLQQLAAAGRK